MAQWEHWLGADWDRGRRSFVADDRGDLIGVVLAGPDPDDEHRGQLARLYVAPERWGEGIGRRLYDAAIDSLRDQGFTTVKSRWPSATWSAMTSSKFSVLTARSSTRPVPIARSVWRPPAQGVLRRPDSVARGSGSRGPVSRFPRRSLPTSVS